jgi:arginine deiminase
MIRHIFSTNRHVKLQSGGKITFATIVLSCLLLGSPVKADSVTKTSSESAQKSAQCAMSVAEITDLIGRIQAGAPAEWLKAKDIVMHQPGEEIFLGLVHPDAALFAQPFSLDGAIREHENFVCLLRDSGARVFKLTDILLAGAVDSDGHVIQGKPLADLQQFAEKALTYDTAGLPESMQAAQLAYRQKVIQSLHPKELIEIIFQRPTVKLSSTDSLNTGFVASYTLDPVMNMYFMRDQVITTPKGIVVGKFNSRQRDNETEIADFAYRKLGTTPIYAVQGDGRLEGGDYLVGDDISFLGQGLRTNEQAVKQLLDAGVFGTKRVVVVKDPWQNQIQMHLDTYFNLISDQLAAMVQDRLDIKDESGKVIRQANPKKKPTADIYELQGDSYQLIESDVPFQGFLESIGYKIVPVSEDDQLKYGLNFLTTSSNKILAIDGVSPEYKDRLKAEGVDATWMDFRNLTSGYGAAHCTTQVILRGQ